MSKMWLFVVVLDPLSGGRKIALLAFIWCLEVGPGSRAWLFVVVLGSLSGESRNCFICTCLVFGGVVEVQGVVVRGCFGLLVRGGANLVYVYLFGVWKCGVRPRHFRSGGVA